ncbi:MAG: IclR family transcriptional regulator [Haloplanus sp.]
MVENRTDETEVKTARRVFEIIEIIRTVDEIGVTELANEMEIAKSTAHGYLSTMERMGYLVKEDGKYQLSLKFLDHGIYKRQQIVSWNVVGQTLKQLSNETSEIAWFTVEEHGRACDIYKSEGERAITVETWIGQAKPMHALAAGKALLALMPDEEIRAIVDTYGLETRTENTIATEAELFEELEEIRDAGVAFNDEEYTRGIRSVGAPVVFDGEAVGAVTVSGPANRMKGDRFRQELPDLLLGAANEIELKMQSLL